MKSFRALCVVEGGRTVPLFDVIARLGGRVTTGDMWHLEHGHRTVEQPMHNFESGRLVAPHRGRVPHVARLALARRVFEHDVRRLKDAQRERVRAVLPDRLEQAREERRAHHLELERFRVRDLDRRLAVISRVEPGKIFLVGALATEK
jgi:hypothetical protein